MLLLFKLCLHNHHIFDLLILFLTSLNQPVFFFLQLQYLFFLSFQHYFLLNLFLLLNIELLKIIKTIFNPSFISFIIFQYAFPQLLQFLAIYQFTILFFHFNIISNLLIHIFQLDIFSFVLLNHYLYLLFLFIFYFLKITDNFYKLIHPFFLLFDCG